MAVFLTVGALTLIVSPDETPLFLVMDFLQMGIGLIAGIVLGWLAVSINKINLDYEGLYPRTFNGIGFTYIFNNCFIRQRIFSRLCSRNSYRQS